MASVRSFGTGTGGTGSCKTGSEAVETQLVARTAHYTHYCSRGTSSSFGSLAMPWLE